MDIISISLPTRLRTAVDDLVADSNFSGRSAVIRTAIQTFLQEQQDINALNNTVDAVIVVTHDEDDSDITALQHDYESLITTQLHNHLANQGCLELFILRGDAEDVRNFWKELQSANAVHHAELLLP